MGVVESLSHLMMHSVRDTDILMFLSRLNVLPLRILLICSITIMQQTGETKIYALVGMSTEASLSIMIDYTKSWKKGAVEPTIIRLHKSGKPRKAQFFVIVLSIGLPNSVWFPAP
jgi:hypothetical protein